jgi:hypothetical protein
MFAAVGTLLHERAEIGEAADIVELLYRGKRFGHRHDVRRLAFGRQLQDVRVDEAMRLAVEVGVAQDVADLVDRLVVEQKAAQHRLLRLQRMGGKLDAIELRVVGHGVVRDRGFARSRRGDAGIARRRMRRRGRLPGGRIKDPGVRQF